MKASLHQYNLDHALGHNIAAVLDSTNRYCIFSFLDKGFRKNVAVDIRSCKPVADGYVNTKSTTWRNMRTWTPQRKAYRVEKLTGCNGNIFITFICVFVWIVRSKLAEV